jgi:hypothetical protein
MYVGTKRFSSCKRVSTGKRNYLDPPVEIIAVCVTGHAGHGNEVCGIKHTVLYVRSAGIYSNHSVLMV